MFSEDCFNRTASTSEAVETSLPLTSWTSRTAVCPCRRIVEVHLYQQAAVACRGDFMSSKPWRSSEESIALLRHPVF